MKPLRAAARVENAVKRLLDIVVATTLLVVLAPVLLIVAALVRIRLGQPVVYKQQRPGLHGRPFTIYKFRTMLDTTDTSGQPCQALSAHPRSANAFVQPAWMSCLSC